MPYFQRPAVDRTFQPARRELVSRRLSSPERPHKAAVAPSLVERAAAILAREPAVSENASDDGWQGCASPAPAAMLAARASVLPCAPNQVALATTAPLRDVALLDPGHPVPAGTTAVVPLTLANDDSAAVTLGFVATDLLSGSGGSLPARQVTFVPAQIALAAGAQETIQIRIAVPAGAPSGSLTGLIQTTGDDCVRAVIELQVAG
jgi:hypothetical protein